MRTYQALLSTILNHGEDHDDRTGTGTLSTWGLQFRHDMQEGFPLLTTKKLPFRWIAEELFWFLSGSTDERDLRARGVDIWQEWATAEQCARFGRPEGELGPIYGHLWRNFGGWLPGQGNSPGDGIDQIVGLMHDLNVNPNSRRLIVTGWYPENQRDVALPPCHTLWQMKTHPDGGLSIHLYARSIDCFLGLPFNIASYALLLSLIAECVGRWPKWLVISFGDLHLYKNHIDQAMEQLLRGARQLPTLSISGLPAGGIEGLLAARYENLDLRGYRPLPAIKAEVSV